MDDLGASTVVTRSHVRPWWLCALLSLAACAQSHSRRDLVSVDDEVEPFVWNDSTPAASPVTPRTGARAPDAGAELSLVAGALGGLGHLDGVGTNARLGNVVAMATPDQRTVYFTDATFHTLRSLTLPAREVRTLAGLADRSGSTDGVGAEARFFALAGIALEGTTGVYVADRGNQTIRRFDVATGRVETIAGVVGTRGGADGPAKQATFDFPSGLALRGAHLFVADTGGHAVRDIDLEKHTVTTLPTTLPFRAPVGVAAGRGDEIFVSDQLLDAVFVVNTTNGATRILAGGGVYGYPSHRDGLGSKARFFEPREMVFDAAQNAVFVIERHTAALRRIDVASGAVTTLATLPILSGRKTGELDPMPSLPSGLVQAQDGMFLFSDQGEIRALAPRAQFAEPIAGRRASSVARDGVGAAAVLGDVQSLEPTDDGRVFAGDCRQGRIRRVDLGTGAVDTVSIDRMTKYGPKPVAIFGCPSGMAADGRGGLLVADRSTAALYSVRFAPPDVTIVAGSPGVSGTNDGSLEDAHFVNPSHVVFDRATSRAYVSDASVHTIRVVDLHARTVSTLAGAARQAGHVDGVGGAARFAFPTGLALDARGTLYVADRNTHCIRTIDTKTGAVATLTGARGVRGAADGSLADATFDEPVDLRLSPSGATLFVVDRTTIRAIDLAGGKVRAVIRQRGGGVGVALGALPRPLSAPSALLPLTEDTLAVADGGEGAVLLASGIFAAPP